MLYRKHISLLIICPIAAFLLSGCRDTVDYSSSPVIPGGEEESNTTVNTSSAVSAGDESGTSTAPENTVDGLSSKPSNQGSSNSLYSSVSTGSAVSDSSNTASHLHIYKKITVAPTCNKDGITYFECVECGKKKDETVIKSTGHIWGDWAVIKEATYSDSGTKERECKVCHEKETEKIPDYPALREELLNLVNKARKAAGLTILEENTQLQAKADERALEIAESFDNKSNENYVELIYNSSLTPNGGLTAQDIFDYWKSKSESTLLSNKYSSTAIGVVFKNGKFYLVQIFS